MGSFATLQPRPDASIASPTLTGGRSSTAPNPCHGVTRTENIESESVSPADIAALLRMVGPARCGAGRSPGRIPTGDATMAGQAGPRTMRATAHDALARSKGSTWTTQTGSVSCPSRAREELTRSRLGTGRRYRDAAVERRYEGPRHHPTATPRIDRTWQRAAARRQPVSPGPRAIMHGVSEIDLLDLVTISAPVRLRLTTEDSRRRTDDTWVQPSADPRPTRQGRGQTLLGTRSSNLSPSSRSAQEVRCDHAGRRMRAGRDEDTRHLHRVCREEAMKWHLIRRR